MKEIIKVIFYSCIAVSVFSCKVEKVDPSEVDSGYDYYPTEVGRFWVYEVEKTSYSIGAPNTVDTFYVREVIDTTTFSFDSELRQILRYKKTSLEDAWELDSLWTTKLTPKNAQRTEQNIKFLKMTFPIEEEKTWNGNAYNSKGYEPFSYKDVKKPFALSSGAIFTETATVLNGENMEPNLIETDQRYEVYAKGIGKVYKFHKVLRHQPPEFDSVGVKQITKLIKYGL